MISPEQTEVRKVLPPGVPHDTRICIEDLIDIEQEKKGHEIDQLREEREVQDESDIRHGELVHRHRNKWDAQPISSAAAWVEEASKSETHVGSCSVSNEECKGLSKQVVTVLSQ